MAEGKGNHAIVRMHPNAAIHGLAARLCAAWPWHSGSSVSQQFLHQCAFCSRFLQRPSLVAAVEGTSPSPSRLEALLAPRRLTAPGERAAVAAGSRRRLRRAFVSEFDDRLEEVSDDSVVCNLRASQANGRPQQARTATGTYHYRSTTEANLVDTTRAAANLKTNAEPHYREMILCRAAIAKVH
eukprot:GHVT01090737.1.p1 GENE.GHVT01090737.1~~GHVT01090737.1.p1  ORF type:complete len:184 (+),score=35.07 GHVT01090737.1:419-970(+)